MRQHLGALAVTIGLLAGLGRTQAAAADEICRQLRAFEIAPFANGADDKPLSRSVTFLWFAGWLSKDMSWGCRRKKEDAASVALCSYLVQHTSLEFRMTLPIRVLRCYGYRFPRGTALDWSKWKAEIALHGQRTDRSLSLHVDFDPEKSPDATVSISAVPDDASADEGSGHTPGAS